MLFANLLAHLILLDDLLVLCRIVAVPHIPLRLPSQLNLYKHLVATNILASVLGSHFARPFNALLGVVRHGATVGTGALTELGDSGCGRHEATLVICIDRLLFPSLLLALMVQHLSTLALRCLLVHVPRSILDELGHVLQVDLLDCRLFVGGLIRCTNFVLSRRG